MCIYCGTKHYRKIYENHHGPIPKEEDGRTYEIHHIDGERTNNIPTNLVALSIKEHFDIHYQQSDFGACLRIGAKMEKTPAELSALATVNNLKKVAEGRHPLQTRPNGTNVQTDRASKRTHHFLRRADGSSVASDRYKAGYVSPFARNTDGSPKNGGKNHPEYDHTIYGFRHKLTGKEVYETQHNFCATFNLDRRNVFKVTRGSVNTVKGWQLITTPSK